MTIVTKNQSLARWDTLPDTLREALYSEPNSDFVWKTAAAENIPEEKIYTVAQVAGFVLLGFLHPEDVGQELVDVLKIDAKTGKDIQDALNTRIFNPLRADLDKVYSPLSKSEVLSGPLAMDLKPLQGTGVAPRPMQKPTTLSDVGWSKASSAGPGITLTTVSSAPTPTPAPSAPSEPAPVMLHEDTAFKAAGKNAGFTLSRPGSGAEVHMAPGVPQAPQKPAVLEFGGSNNKPPVPANKPATTPSSGALHYSELTLSLSAVPTANSGPRNVSQMVTPAPASAPMAAPAPTPTPAPAPRPPMPPTLQASSSFNTVPLPPRPPQAPQPSQPQQQPTQTPQAPQNSKPIVKDFL